MKLIILGFLITLNVIQAQDWPVRLRKCQVTNDCYNLRECCQRQDRRKVCIPFGYDKSVCIGEDTRGGHQTTTSGYTDKGGFCPNGGQTTRSCRKDRDCPGPKKCCNRICTEPIFP
ncbi:Uncharacterised protein g4289 [Pycnogonum litorale]